LQEALALAHDYLATYASHLEKHLARRTGGRWSGRVLLFLGALLHDVGKPASRTVDEEGRIRFLGHEQLGEEIARRQARKLALSARKVRQVAAMVRHHMRPALLSQTSPAARPSRRAIHRFFRDVGANGLDICLLSLADGLAKGGPPEPADWERRVQTVATLLDHFFHRYDRTVSPPPLLNGRELMSELGIRPGPEVGRLLRLIQEAQAAGEVATVAGALTLARESSKSMENEPDIRLDR
jgi:putative nucleotidyltransferase with HDIG domain